MREKYSFRAQTRTTYTSAISIKSIQSQVCSSKMLEPQDAHPLEKLLLLLDKKTRNKKRYFLQILKQFVLFPDSSINSSVSSVSGYFAVLTGEEKMHSLFKIVETQMMERKIWAFLNLTYWKKARRIAQALPICEGLLQKKRMDFRLEGLYAIKERAREQRQVLSHQRLLNITIVNQTPKKSVKNESINKSDYNVSRQTQVESCLSEKSIPNRPHFSDRCYFSCRGCYCVGSCCCCLPCDYNYNLQERIQYLRVLQEMAQQYDLQ